MAVQAPVSTPPTEGVRNDGTTAADDGSPHHSRHGVGGFMALMIGSVGVVFGDIGTSPLYAMREALADFFGIPPGRVVEMGAQVTV